ncbi:MAG: LCP family protein [Oscillospiraceae bacterium]|nr:LCP family protein [Oscillospiraceae bacterium]
MLFLVFAGLLLAAALGALARSKSSRWLYLSLASLAAIFLFLARFGGVFSALCPALLPALAAFTAGALISGLARSGLQRRNKAVDTGSAARDKKRRRSNSRSAALVCALLILLACGALSLIVSPARSSALKGVESTPLSSPSVNILLCGVDNDPNDPYHQQRMADVIAVVSLDFKTKSAAMLQIPRDTYVGSLTSTGKINALYNLGDSPEEGLNALASAVSEQLCLPLDHYATINMEGFRAAVDALGGVTVTLESDMSFNYYDVEGNVTGTVYLPAGENLLDGVTADLFVRYRNYARADLDRIEVQRYFYAGLINRLSTASVPQLIAAVSAAYPYLETDYSLAQLAALALRFRGASAENINMISVPGEALTYGGQSVYSAHKEALAELLNSYMRPYSEPVAAEELGVIELANTTSWNDGGGSSLSEYGA